MKATAIKGMKPTMASATGATLSFLAKNAMLFGEEDEEPLAASSKRPPVAAPTTPPYLIKAKKARPTPSSSVVETVSTAADRMKIFKQMFDKACPQWTEEHEETPPPPPDENSTFHKKWKVCCKVSSKVRLGFYGLRYMVIFDMDIFVPPGSTEDDKRQMLLVALKSNKMGCQISLAEELCRSILKGYTTWEGYDNLEKDLVFILHEKSMVLVTPPTSKQ